MEGGGVLESAIRSCTACSSRAKCRCPVPGEGPADAKIIAIGEAPGRTEDERGRPFCGQAGQFLDALLRSVGVEREDIYIDNVVHCRPPANKTPTEAQARECGQRWLDIELARLSPELIVCVGRTSAMYLLKGKLPDTEKLTMEYLHGRPYRVDGRVILPVYHPASGLGKGGDVSKQLRNIYEDFQVLGRLVRGVQPESIIPQDEYPNPRYVEVKSKREAKALLNEPEYALDLETVENKLWSVQISLRAGEGYFIPAELMPSLELPATSEVTVHNYLHDCQYLTIPTFLDTMIAAYLLGLPQGLKELAARLCGMSMREYREMVRPYGRPKAINYLQRVVEREWPDPDKLEEFKWDEKAGEVGEKSKQPQNIARKVKRILKQAEEDSEADPHEKWIEIDARERVVVEDVLGVMPTGTIADADRAEAVSYSVRDSDATIRVRDKMMPMIREYGLEYVLRCVDLPALPVVREMMDQGIAVDARKDGKLKELSNWYGQQMKEAAAEAAKIAGHPFNPNSRPQVAKVIYKELGFTPTKYTPIGMDASTDDGELKKVKHPIVDVILRYRNASKNKGSFADTLLAEAEKDGSGITRMHKEIKVTRTETGRLAIARLQQIPKRSEEGRKIRSAFTAPEGKLLLAADDEQQELRILAHLSRCKAMLDVFLRGEDPHTDTASRVFGVPIDKVTPDMRTAAKVPNFGVSYGMETEGLRQNMIDNGVGDQWPLERCEDLLKAWFRAYPEVRDYQLEQAAYGRRWGYVKDMFGRIRFLPELLCPINKVREEGAKKAANMPVQSTGAGKIKIAMWRIAEERDRRGWRERLWFVLQIHDELLWEVEEGLEVEAGRMVKEVMENVLALAVPMPAEVKVGKNWGEMKKLELN